jgi:hypothetical protein
MGTVGKPEVATEDWVTLAEAARLLNLSRFAALNLAIKGDIDAAHIAGRTVVSRSSIERHLARPETANA